VQEEEEVEEYETIIDCAAAAAAAAAGSNHSSFAAGKDTAVHTAKFDAVVQMPPTPAADAVNVTIVMAVYYNKMLAWALHFHTHRIDPKTMLVVVVVNNTLDVAVVGYESLDSFLR